MSGVAPAILTFPCRLSCSGLVTKRMGVNGRYVEDETGSREVGRSVGRSAFDSRDVICCDVVNGGWWVVAVAQSRVAL